MGKVIAFPGTTPPRQPMRIEDLPAGAKALVITASRGEYLVTMFPAITSDERALCQRFDTVYGARRYATALTIQFPRLYRLVIDQTADADTLDTIMRRGPGPSYDGDVA